MKPYYADDSVTLWHGDALDVLRGLPDGSVNCAVTSPPYFGLRDYGEPGQYGLEESPAAYVETMRAVFAEVRRVLADDGTLWLNLGDSYVSVPGSGKQGATGELASRTIAQVRDSKAARGNTARRPPSVAGLVPKNLLGMPWRVAFALQDDGWILRNRIVWHKPNAMPESVTDRLSSRCEDVFLFAKSPRYWFDLDAIREPYIDDYAKKYPNGQGGKRGNPNRRDAGIAKQRTADDLNPAGRNPGDVWSIATRPFSAAHFAVMPAELPERCILAGCKPAPGTVGGVRRRPTRRGNPPDSPL